jgi:hypothetical protein
MATCTMSSFDWKRKIDLDYFFDWEKKYNKKRQISHTVEREQGKMYFYSQGNVWIGKAKSEPQSCELPKATVEI